MKKTKVFNLNKESNHKAKTAIGEKSKKKTVKKNEKKAKKGTKKKAS